MEEQLETKTNEIENPTNIERNIKETKKIEIIIPAETSTLIDYKDPITDEYILEKCNILKEKRFCEELWQKKNRDIHIWM